MAYVNSAGNSGTAATSTTIACTLSGAVGSGNLLAFYLTGIENFSTLADDQGNSVAGGQFVQVDNDGVHRTYYGKNITNGPITFTLTVSVARAFLSIMVMELSGRHLTAPLDGHNIKTQVNPGTAANAVNCGAVVTTVNGCDIFSGVNDDSNFGANPWFTEGTSPNAFTKRTEVGDATHLNVCLENFVQTTAASITPTWTLGGGGAGDDTTAVGMGFAPAAGGATPTLWARGMI